MAGIDPSPSTLVERERELLTLSQSMDRAEAGSGSVTMIEAVAGAGKTALLDHAQQLGDNRAMRVLRARGAEIDRDVPLALLRDLFAPRIAVHPDRDTIMAGAAGVLVDALELAHPRPTTGRELGHAAYWLVADLAIHEPLALLVDDLQWADRSSIDALARICERADELGIAVVLAHRPEDVDTAPGILANLSATAAVQLRLASLTRSDVAAVLGLRLDGAITEACAVAGVSREDGLRAAPALARHGIFARDRVTAYTHPLVRDAMEAGLADDTRRLLRERAVRALLDAGADVPRNAELLLRTDPAGDPRAAAALRSAARAASAAAAPGRAAVLLRRALSETPRDREPLDEVIAAEIAGGDFTQAAHHIRARLRRDVSPQQRADLIRRLGRVVQQSEGIPAAVALLDDELSRLDGDGRLLVEAGQMWMCMLHPPLSGRVQRAIANNAELAGETPGERAMLAMVGVALTFTPGDASAATVAPIVARAFGEGALLADEGRELSLYPAACYSMVVTGQFELAEREVTRAERAAREHGSVAIAMPLTARAMARLHLGRIADAETDALAAIEAAELAAGSLQRLVCAAAIGIVVEDRAERGDDNGAMGILGEHGLLGDLGSDPELRALASRAHTHLLAGRPREALDDARRVDVAIGGYQAVHTHSDRIESPALLALGDRLGALASAERQLARARPWGVPSVTAGALRAAGLARGGGEGAALLAEAVTLVDDDPAALESARCLVALGVLRRENGDRSAALDALRRGCDLAQRIGARAIAKSAYDELRALGTRPRRLAFSGADALTAAERRSARLAADGCSNREIAQELYLSLKTVESNLSRAYRKLGIRSRDELAAALGKREPEDS